MKSIIKIYVFLLLFFVDIAFGQQQLQSHSNGIETIQIAGHTIYSNAVNFKCLYGAEDRNASIRVSFPFPDVVRVQIHQVEEPFAEDIGQSLDIKQKGNLFELKTDSLRVTIQK